MRHAILIVDDNPDACAMTAKMLWSLGYQADVAYDCPTALKLINEQSYALAIIDYQLREMNGIELFREMRHRRAGLTGIFLTGFATIDVVYPAIEAGILRILPKPIDFGELMPIVDQFVGQPT